MKIGNKRWSDFQLGIKINIEARTTDLIASQYNFDNERVGPVPAM